MKLKIAIRANDTLTDLFGYNRIAVEEYNGRLFLVGVRHTGKVIALYALRRGVTAEEVMNGLSAAVGSGKAVCVLTNELIDISADTGALTALAEHNEFSDGIAPSVGTPHTLATSGTNGR